MNKNPFDNLDPNDFENDEKLFKKKLVQREIIPLTDPKGAVEKGFRAQTPRFDPKKVLVFRLEDGFPTVDEARRILRLEFDKQRRKGVKLMKVIHGYGSTGKGGSLGKAMPDLLNELQNTGAIESFVSGENFNCFSGTTTELLGKYTALKKDRDYGNKNSGISIVEL